MYDFLCLFVVKTINLFLIVLHFIFHLFYTTDFLKKSSQNYIKFVVNILMHELKS